MRFALSSAIFVASCLLHPSALASAKGVQRLHPLQPNLKGNPLRDADGTHLQKRKPTVIEGLLRVRQLTCPSGYGLCDNGGCCPLGDSCCPDHCCKPGYFCYSEGCCENSEKGCEGISCCPGGSTCCSDGSCCQSGYNCCSDGGCCQEGFNCVTTSSGDRGCCPIGETCVGGGSDTNGGNGEGGGGGGGGTTPQPAPTTKTTAKATSAKATPPPNTEPPNTETPDFPSITAPANNSTSGAANSPGFPTAPAPPAPSPTAAFGQSITHVSVTDESITWSSGWVTTGASSCTNNSRKTTTAMQSFTAIVQSATEIYLNVDCSNALFLVYVDGQQTTIDDFEITETCSYKQVTTVSTTNINVTVVVVGLPPSAGNRRQVGGSEWSYQLNEILTVSSNSAGTGGSSSAGAPGLGVSWFNSMAAMLLAGLLGFAL